MELSHDPTTASSRVVRKNSCLVFLAQRRVLVLQVSFVRAFGATNYAHSVRYTLRAPSTDTNCFPIPAGRG